MHHGRGNSIFPAYSSANRGAEQNAQPSSSLGDGRRFGEKDEDEQLENFRRTVKVEAEEEERRELKHQRQEKLQKLEENSNSAIMSVDSKVFDDLMDDRVHTSSRPSSSYAHSGMVAERSGAVSSSTADRAGEASSSTDSSSSESSREKRKKHRHKDQRKHSKGKKEKKRERKKQEKEAKKIRKEERRRKRRAADSSLDDRDDSKRRKVLQIVPAGHCSKNPWRLLKREEWAYSNSHLVLQPTGDSMNRDMKESYHRDVPQYRRLNWVLTSGHSSPFPLGDSAAPPQRQERYFSKKAAVATTQKMENRFRKKEIEPGASFIPISSQPYSEREDQLSVKLGDVAGIDLNTADHGQIKDFVTSRNVDYDKAALEQKAAILRDITNQRDPHNVDAWIKLVRLQKDLFEQQEPGGAITNKKALHDRQIAIVDAAIAKNLASADLRLERLMLVEDFYGASADRVKREWAETLNRFNSSVKLWRTNIALRQNNRSAFKLIDTLKAMDRCMENMLAYLRGQKKSHAVEEGTEQFLAELIEQRCALLIETGNAHKAAASLQALAEFHFFAPAVDRSQDPMEAVKELQEKFGKFWDSLTRKIGDNGAVGWANATERSGPLSGLPPLSEVIREEFAIREAQFVQAAAGKSKYPNVGEFWKQYDLLAAGHQWWPLRFGEGGKEHQWREVDYQKIDANAGVQPLVFLFSQRETAQELVLRLLQLFGAVVPGMEDYSQQGLMRSFSHPAIVFPNFQPDYRHVSTFLYNFIALMVRADGVNVPRLIATYIQTYAKFARQSGGTGNSESKRRALVDSLRTVVPVGDEFQNAVALFLSLTQCLSDDDEGELKRITKKLIAILAQNKRNVWEMESGERLLHLRMYQFLAEHLAEGGGGGLTRLELLTRLALVGNIRADAGSTTTDEDIANARAKWDNVLLCDKTLPDLAAGVGTSEVSSQLSWLGSEPTILLELAALFYYEESGHNELVFEQSLASSPLGQRCGNDKAIYWLRIRVYEHKMRHSSSLTRKDYKRLIWEAVEKFPLDAQLLKKYMSTENCSFVLRYQLGEHQEDPRVRLVRNCARIYLEWKLHLENAELATAQSNLLRIQSAIERAIKGIEAGETSSRPDSYLRCLLLFVEEKMGRGNRVEETFTLGQKYCPWSMALVREAAPAASLYKRDLLKSVITMAEGKGLCIHRSMLEAEVLHTTS